MEFFLGFVRTEFRRVKGVLGIWLGVRVSLFVCEGVMDIDC